MTDTPPPPPFGKLLKLPVHAPGTKPTLQNKGFSSDACRCRRFSFTLKSRQVHCSDCGKLWDPFDAMVSMAHDWTFHAQNLVALKKEHEQLAKAVGELRTQRSSLRSQVRKRGERPVG